MNVNERDLIADQAKQIYFLKNKVEDYEQALKAIKNVTVCIGGPLNDNVLGYSKEQLGPFSRILNRCEEVLRYYDDGDE